jgi:hypothetical protein
VSVENLVKQAKDVFVKTPRPNATNNSVRSTSSINDDLDKQFYATEPSNWFKAPPYGFRWQNREGKQFFMMLPISPSNIQITTHYATNVVTTLYGTVEEHSEQRYFDIRMSGVTGMTPRFVEAMEAQQLAQLKANSSTGRLSYGDSTDGRIGISSDIAGGFFAKTIGTVNAALNKAQDVISGREDQNRSGVFLNKSGYLAFHRLKKFFLKYKADMVGLDPNNPNVINSDERKPGSDNNLHPLMFMNYKDNCKYHCSIQKFDVIRDAANPLMYSYNIVLRAYNIEPIDSLQGDVGNRLADFGLDGVKSSSLLTEVKNISNGAKQIFGAALGGINILGR